MSHDYPKLCREAAAEIRRQFASFPDGDFVMQSFKSGMETFAKDYETMAAVVEQLQSRLDHTSKLVTHQATQIHELEGRLDETRFELVKVSTDLAEAETRALADRNRLRELCQKASWYGNPETLADDIMTVVEIGSTK